MNCSDISTLAPLYLAEELEPARATAFSAHLSHCAACKQELAQQILLDQQLRASLLVEKIDSSSVDRRVRDSIHAAQRTSRRWLLAAAGIAAVLLVAIASYGTLFSSRTKTVDAAAAHDHRVEIVDRQPRKWLADRGAIEKLAEHEGLSSSAVAAFVPAGYHLAQGKLCFLDGRIFLHLVYANEAGTFSLFLRRSSNSAASDIRTGTFGAEHVAGFQHGPLTAVIVSEQAGGTVLDLARSAAAVL